MSQNIVITQSTVYILRYFIDTHLTYQLNIILLEYNIIYR